MQRVELKLANKENGPVALRITEEDIVKKLKSIVLSHWDITDVNFFPAPQPVSLERRDLYKLVQFKYLVCPKSDGMRFVLINYDNKSYMVDRAFKFYSVELSFLPDSNNILSCILDGELIMNKNEEWVFIVHDSVNIHGNDIGKIADFNSRYSQAEKYIDNFFISEKSVFKVVKKKFFEFKDLKILHNLIKEDKIDHFTDGLIFTPKNKKVGSHTQYDLFKWKPRELHTFDFKVIITEENITALVNKNGEHVPYASAKKKSPEGDIFMDGLNKNCKEFTDNNIVECQYNDDNDTFYPIKLRLDKTYPNSLFTVKKTLSNIKENITINELIKLNE